MSLQKIKDDTFVPSFLAESKTLRVSNAEKGAPHLFLMVLPPLRRHNHFALVRIPCAKIKDGTFVPSFSGGEQGIRTLEYSLKHYTISNRAPSASSDNSPYLKIYAAESRGFSFANRFYNNIPRYVKSYFAQNSIYYA